MGDTHWVLGWDQRVQKYVGYFRPRQKFRTIGRSESDDFLHWSTPTEILLPDGIDLHGDQFYGTHVFKDHGVYFGLLCVYHASSLMRDVQLAFSRDGIH